MAPGYMMEAVIVPRLQLPDQLAIRYFSFCVFPVLHSFDPPNDDCTTSRPYIEARKFGSQNLSRKKFVSIGTTRSTPKTEACRFCVLARHCRPRTEKARQFG